MVAIHKNTVLAEGWEVSTVDELVDNLPQYDPTLFVTLGAADFIAMLNRVYLLRTPDTWMWRLASHERSLCPPNGVMQATRVSAAINFFGWKHRSNGRYHKIIDPITVYGHGIDAIWPENETVVVDSDWNTTVKLLKWGVTLRDFCHENNIDVRPTLGSMAAQFLANGQFYPKARRKVPAKINQRVRESLPGNHYFLNVKPEPSNNFTAHYLDQHRAHHYHARHTRLPDSNHCFAYGRFTDLAGPAFADTDPEFMGLYCLDLRAPDRPSPFDWIGDNLESRFVYSNELPHLLDRGYRVRAVRAAWGSIQRDTGIQRYATFAEAQLDMHGDPAWLKPLLLATYGALATRPLVREAIYRLAKRGTPVRIPTGRYNLMGLRIQSTRKLEPAIAHVLQRGMIEAACRSESIGLAQWLDHQRHTILSIYADAVMVEVDDDKPLPFLPDPWRCKRTLNHLQFINRQAFKSDGMTKLPGIGREALQYTQKSPGHAPRRTHYEALTGRAVTTNRRIK